MTELYRNKLELRQEISHAVRCRNRFQGFHQCELVPCTGGVGRHGRADAVVARDLLISGGAGAGEIMIEDRATDTLESVLFCHAILSARADADHVVPCSSGYHLPRCALLLRLLGYRVRTGAMPPDRPHVALRQWLLYVAKEILAMPYDAVLLLLRRFARR